MTKGYEGMASQKSAVNNIMSFLLAFQSLFLQLFKNVDVIVHINGRVRMY